MVTQSYAVPLGASRTKANRGVLVRCKFHIAYTVQYGVGAHLLTKVPLPVG